MSETQLSMFAGPALARRTDPETSKIAARRIESKGKADAHRRKILAAVKTWPGKTSAELAPLAGMDRHAAARRLPELEASSYVRKGKPRVCGQNGTAAVTWWPV